MSDQNDEYTVFKRRGGGGEDEDDVKDHRPLVYLACPYTHDEESVMEMRFEKVTQIGAELASDGYSVFSPISMSHPMKKYGLPGNWEFWAKFDEDFISCSNKLFVLMIDGWETSTGVTAEIKIAQKMGIPIMYLKYLEISVRGDGKHFEEAVDGKHLTIIGEND